MDKISHKVTALGGIITMADMVSEAEYKRIHRAAQRGELTRLRSGVYASPDALLDTMFDIVVSGHSVRITNLERSVCDAVKYRNKIGLDVCAEIVRTYLKKEERNLSLLTEYAKSLRAWSTLKNYLEIAIE